MALVQFVTNLDLDDQTVDELRALRSIRIETTKNLLDNIDQTLQELIEIGNISQDDVTEDFVLNLKHVLSSKLRQLTSRTYKDHFFDDEIALFSDIEVSSAWDKK